MKSMISVLVAIILLVSSVPFAECQCLGPIRVRLDTSDYTGSTARFVFDLTSSGQFSNYLVSDNVTFAVNESDGKRQVYDSTIGGTIRGNFFGPSAVPFNQVWIYSEAYLRNTYNVDFDSLGTYVNFDFSVFDFPDTASHPSEFVFRWMFFPSGLNPDLSIDMFKTSDPLGGNILFSVVFDSTLCELSVYSPAEFVSPDSILIRAGVIGLPPDAGGVKELRVLGAFPNPMHNSLQVQFEAPESEWPIRLHVFDVQGRLVFETSQELVGSEGGFLVWPGTDAANRAVASGIYFAQIAGARKSIVRKVVVAR